MSSPAAVSFSPARKGAALVDAHSPLHAIVGFTAGILGIDPHIATLTFIGARIVEAALRSGTKHAVFEREDGKSLGNEMVNLLFELGGLHLGEHLREQLLEPPPAAPAAGLGYDYFDPRTFHYDDFMSYPRGYR